MTALYYKKGLLMGRFVGIAQLSLNFFDISSYALEPISNNTLDSEFYNSWTDFFSEDNQKEFLKDKDFSEKE